MNNLQLINTKKINSSGKNQMNTSAAVIKIQKLITKPICEKLLK